MKFNSKQADEAAAIMTMILALLLIVGMLGYALYLMPLPLAAFLLACFSVPIIAGFWPTKEKK